MKKQVQRKLYLLLFILLFGILAEFFHTAYFTFWTPCHTHCAAMQYEPVAE